ncbi:PREDICTED: nuclear distribution protein nudE homolog 1-like isoform X2 [Priapulus caudatus]|uniref:Nuclear distribution protein nudE homolog 1-like isoform X2 n=1 Tax=Priapulus caudatus TaxID=37621 RepID=A0ABM1ELW2_PRICU|nr:PREDICTED: nuclear distribution protein nudE homolog 1-like isoform X2 [Priapulus caudatus]
MEEARKSFSSVEEEKNYWKEQTKNLQTEYNELKEEFSEFQIGSQELESELESHLEQLEKKNKDLLSSSARLQMDCETYREKLENGTRESHQAITSMQTELGQVTQMKDDLIKYIRELEQSNDDLERAKRATVVSLEDFEGRLNQAIERNVFLESELDEKESLQIAVQRLKDETRDLKQELAVHGAEEGEETNNEQIKKEKNDIEKENKMISSPVSPLPKTPGTPLIKGYSQSGDLQNTPLTPSARISALNIVSDLLRKVGTLESKLASCRQLVDQNGTPVHAAYRHLKVSPANSPRAKRMHRGETLPAKIVL